MRKTKTLAVPSIDLSGFGGPPRANSAGRTIHFIDIENIAKGPNLTRENVANARALYFRSGLYRPGDLTFVACSKANAMAARKGWPEGSFRVGSGRDGADFQLLQMMKDERIPERFAKVIVASGDGIFAGQVERLGRHGVDVTVVSPPRGLSTRLRCAASRHAFIDTEALTMFFANPREAA